MVRGLYVAANSLVVQEACHDTIATNLANVSTPGYRRAVTSVEAFPVALARAVSQSGAFPQASADQPAPVTHLSARQTTDFTPGLQQPTDNPCDLALDGPGFFVVEAAAGEAYTRCGSFTLDSEQYLATSSGHRLLGAAGPIKVSGHEWRVNPSGDVICDGAVLDRVRVVDFDSRAALSRLGENLFSAGGPPPAGGAPPAGAAAPAPTPQQNPSIRQGYIESSNVNAVSEMVNLITAMRAFEANQKVVQAMDQTLDRAVNEVGRV